MRSSRLLPLLALLAGCATAGSSSLPPTAAVRPLPPASTVFVRISGYGALTPPPAPVTYELCLDLVSHALDVHAADTHASVDDVVPNLLRGWKWSVLANAPLTGGSFCWREQFAPGERPGDMRLDWGEPVQGMRLSGDDHYDFSLGPPLQEDGDSVNVLAIRVERGIRYIFLAPGLRVTRAAGSMPPAPLFTLSPGQNSSPHLPELFKIQHKGDVIRAAYRLCLDRQGHMREVIPEVPILGANHGIVETLKTWTFAPQPAQICSVSTFVFSID